MDDSAGPDVLIHGDTHRSAALRHELPLGIVDPLSYFEVNGRRVAVISTLDAGRLPEAVADRLRADGIEVVPDQEVFTRRRRSKSAAEVEGVRRAQAAADTAMAA